MLIFIVILISILSGTGMVYGAMTFISMDPMYFLQSPATRESFLISSVIISFMVFIVVSVTADCWDPVE